MTGRSAGVATPYGLPREAHPRDARWIIRNSPFPLVRCRSTSLEKVDGKAEDPLGKSPDTLVEQAEQGVDYFTIHAARAAAVIPLTANV